MTSDTARAPINGLSHVKGPTHAPLWDLTIPALLRQTVDQFGDNDAAIFCEQDIQWTYAAFAVQIDTLAGGLLRQGFVKGDRIGIWSPNRAEWLLAQFATARIGLILVNINPAYRPNELAYALQKVGCRGIITARAFKSSNYLDMLDQVRPDLPDLQTIICMGDDAPDGMQRFDTVMEQGSRVARDDLDAITNGLSPNDPINIQFTSGTTGQPKGATLTHRNIVNNARFVTDAMEFTNADRLCIPVPFYHCFGMVMGTLGCVTKGATMVIPGEGFDATATLKAVTDHACTALFGVPTMFVAELELPNFGSYDLSHLRTGIMAGAPCPIEVMRNVQSKMNMTGVTIAYGMTETAPVSFQSNVDDPIDLRCSSVGRIHPHVEVRIMDKAGNTKPVGEQGELWTRGYSVMQGYWGDDAQTADAIDADGWMHTGDLATLNAEGFCKITGRVKDMILRGGENIYPKEIEDFLFTHPAVSVAQVFGLPDRKLGEIACAWLILKPGAVATADDITQFCRDHIAYFKVPAIIRFVDEMPMTVTGKPQKFVMREMMMDVLNLTDPI